MDVLQKIYFVMTAIWGFSPLIALAIFVFTVFVLMRAIVQTCKVAAIYKQGQAAKNHREIIGGVLLWSLTFILWLPLIFGIVSQIAKD